MNNIFVTYKRLFEKAAGYLRDIKWLVIFFLGASLTVALTEGASILLLIPILDNGGDLSAYADKQIIGPVALWLNGMEQTTRLIVVVSIMAGVLVVRGGFTLLVGYLSTRIPLEVMSKISQQSLDLVLQADLAFIHRRDFATLRTYFYELPINMSSAVKALVDSFSKIILLCIYLSIMLTISWKMTIGALFFVLTMGIVTKWMLSLRLRTNSKMHADCQVGWGNAILVALMGSNIIRLSNAQSKISELYENSVRQFVNADVKRKVLLALNGPLITTGAGLFICAIIGVAAVANESAEEPWMVAIIIFVVTMYRMVPPASEFFSSTVLITAQLVSFDRMEKFVREAVAETMPNGDVVFPGLQKEIQFKSLDFEYGSAEQDDTPVKGALKDVNLVIPKGSMMALVGASGAGKSTLASLLCRLYDPKNGGIFVDGQDLRSFDVATWRSRISLVSQDIFLFNDTVLNNIRFGFEDVSVEQVREAARMAAAEEFIEELPQGWDTQLGEMGVRLSGGQKQRISIARAILNDPEILVLDEATSHLDSITERAIQDTVERLSKGRTVIVIAHRLSTVMHADSIVVLDKGQVVEQGSHNELVEKRGAYWDLLQHQAFDADASVTAGK